MECTSVLIEEFAFPCDTSRAPLPSLRQPVVSPLPPASCNAHLLGLGQRIKRSLVDAGVIGYQFGTVGVSDGISMGTFGMSYSLQSRDLIADSVETAAGGHWLDGMVVVPGCDKNMPGTLMALGRLNRPGLMVYGGTIRPGCGSKGEVLDIVSAFQSYGRYLQEGQTEEAEKTRYDTIRNACPGAGACGGVSPRERRVDPGVAPCADARASRSILRCTRPTPWPPLPRRWA